MNIVIKAALCLVTATSTAVVTAPADAGEAVKPTIDVNDLRLVVFYVSTGKLLDLQRQHGANIDRRDIRQSHRRGFSILKTNRESGARTCEVYLPEEQRPREVDDAATLSLGHELLHCMYGGYHR